MTSSKAETGEIDEGIGFGRGGYLFLGALAGFFLTAVVAVSVLIITGGGSDAVVAGPATTTADAGTGQQDSGDAVAGAEVFAATCTACHGPDGAGVPGLGPSFAGNEFVGGQSDDELVAFLEVGRSTDDPANTTGVAMPPKGGNPSLDDHDLHDVVAFLRTLN